MAVHIQIDLHALKKNFVNLHTFYSHNSAEYKKICVSIKADAYGHGLVECAKALEKQGKNLPTPHAFGVANVNEIALLKEAKIKTTLFLYSPASTADLEKLFQRKHYKDVEFFVGDETYLKDIVKTAKKYEVKNKLKVHLKSDTGMGRVGTVPEEFLFLCRKTLLYKTIEVVGLCTHLSDSSQDSVTEKQEKKFLKLLEQCFSEEIFVKEKILVHAANSGALLWQKNSYYDIARLGIAVYGVHPEPRRNLPKTIVLHPVMKFYADVVGVKKLPKGHGISYLTTYKTKEDTHVAIINAGYGDGVPVALSNKGLVRIKNTNYPIVGRVCMDMLIIDLGKNTKNIKRGDFALLWGDVNLQVEEQARRAETISYELLCNIGRVNRSTRVFV